MQAAEAHFAKKLLLVGAMRTAKNLSKMCFVGPFGQLKPFKNVFCRAMRTAKNHSKMCFVEPCGQLETVRPQDHQNWSYPQGVIALSKFLCKIFLKGFQLPAWPYKKLLKWLLAVRMALQNTFLNGF